jgi:hypothetical protein
MTALRLLLSALPDSDTAGPDGTGYRHAWDELSAAEQDWVKSVRDTVSASPEQTMQWVLDNIYTIARREMNKADPRGRWAHIFRLCEQAGCQGRGVLRADNAPADDEQAVT